MELSINGLTIQADDSVTIQVRGNTIHVTSVSPAPVTPGTPIVQSIVRRPLPGKRLEELVFSFIPAGGQITQKEIEEKMLKSGELSQYDMEIDSSGLQRWKHRLLSLKSALVKNGRVKAERGMWQLCYC